MYTAQVGIKKNFPSPVSSEYQNSWPVAGVAVNSASTASAARRPETIAPLIDAVA